MVGFFVLASSPLMLFLHYELGLPACAAIPVGILSFPIWIVIGAIGVKRLVLELISSIPLVRLIRKKQFIRRYRKKRKLLSSGKS